MKHYYRVMLGKQSAHAKQCVEQSFIGADFDISYDLTDHLPEEWRTFNKHFVPVFLEGHPGKSRVAAGLACGALWMIAKGIHWGDIVLCSDGMGRYHIGEVSGDYYYEPEDVLPHRRPVQWFSQTIDRAEMSEALRKSTSYYGTVSNISDYREEIEALIGNVPPPTLISTDETIEDPSAFAMERHLEDFLVENWSQTALGHEYNIYEEDGERVGQQYPTDTGPIDILAISKDRKSLLVVELKKGRASDVVVGQTLRYMGFVQSELAEEGQSVRGVIIALEADQRIRRALQIAPNIDFFRYQVSFKLMKE